MSFFCFFLDVCHSCISRFFDPFYYLDVFQFLQRLKNWQELPVHPKIDSQASFVKIEENLELSTPLDKKKPRAFQEDTFNAA